MTKSPRSLARPKFYDERGFTIVELIVASSMVVLLSAISLSTFYVYKDEVIYRKAEATMRNARTAFETGDSEAPSGTSVGITYSQTTGGPLIGVLATILPGAVVSDEVRLGVLYNKCSQASPPVTVNQMLISQPCDGSKYVSWMRTCDGIEVYSPDQPQGSVC